MAALMENLSSIPMIPFVVANRSDGRVIIMGGCSKLSSVPLQTAGSPDLVAFAVDEHQPGYWTANIAAVEEDGVGPYVFSEVCSPREPSDDEIGRSQAELNVKRTEVAALIDAQAEMVRGRFITIGAGQSMVYQQKRVEAEAYLANLAAQASDPATPVLSDGEIPHVANEAAMNGISKYDQAVIIITMSEQWKAISSFIEEKRLAAKQAVNNATTKEDIEAAANVDWTEILSLASAT